jgi:hypothetical protein
LSADEVTLVPEDVVTVISTVPVPAGEVATIWVAEFTVKLEAKIVPNFIAVVPVNPVPVTMTAVPPAAGPPVGEIPVIVGAYVNWSADEVALVPPEVVTVISTVPVPAGDFMVREVAEATTRLVPAVDPNFTAVAPVNPVPVTVTVVLPAAGPLTGEMPVTVGTGAYVNWSSVPVALVPPGVVTVISTIPAVPAGDFMVREVAEATTRLVPAVDPNFTAVAPINPVPVTMTEVPPAIGPLTGEMPVTVGTGAYVNWSAAEVALVPPGVVTFISTTPAEPAGETAVMLVAEPTV